LPGGGAGVIGMVTRFLRYCRGKKFIRIVSERRTRGRYSLKTCALSENGSRLLAIFDEEEKEDAAIRGTKHN
jgi:hypothetical protein